MTVTKVPVLEDGSTYTAGEPVGVTAPGAGRAADAGGQPEEFVFDRTRTDASLETEDAGSAQTKATVTITLAPKAADDMTAEELGAAAEELAAAGNEAASANVSERAQSASPAPGTPSGSGGSNSGSGSSGNSGPAPAQDPPPAPPAPAPDPEPAPPAPAPDPEPVPPHSHNWIAETKLIHRCSICSQDITGNASAHLKNHALAGEGVGSAYSDTVTTGRYYCSCGAWQ